MFVFVKKVVIIGGGFAGAHLAKLLENSFHVTLIDTKDYFEFTPGILRTIVHPEHMKKIQVLHSDYLHTVKRIHGEVTDFTIQFVVVGKRKIPFDYLFVCSGSRYNTPIKEKNIVLPNRGDALRKAHHQLDEAENVLIVGGGVVGVELAAEIIDSYPGKHVTLVHGGAHLLERSPALAQSYAERFFKKRGLTILYNDRLTVDTKNFVTQKGIALDADLCFFCTGIIPNTELFSKHFASSLNERKQVHVLGTLQLENYPHIFVVGDLNDIPEEKTAQAAEKQAAIAATNLFRLENNQTLLSYSSAPKVMVISLGHFRGILSYKNYVLTGFFPAVLKLFIEWKTMMYYR